MSDSYEVLGWLRGQIAAIRVLAREVARVVDCHDHEAAAHLRAVEFAANRAENSLAKRVHEAAEAASNNQRKVGPPAHAQ
jgi:hypothetical protein